MSNVSTKMSDGKFLYNCMLQPKIVADEDGNVSVPAVALHRIIEHAHQLRVDSLLFLMKNRAQTLSLAAVDAEEKATKIYGGIKELCESLDSLLPARPEHPLARQLTFNEHRSCCDSSWMRFMQVTPPCTKCTMTEGRTDYLFQGVKMCWPCYRKTKDETDALRLSNIEKGLACQCGQLLVDDACLIHGPFKKFCKCNALATEINDNGAECQSCSERDLYA